MGAYPTLTAHFAAANLDPQANLWDKVQSLTWCTVSIHIC